MAENLGKRNHAPKIQKIGIQKAVFQGLSIDALHARAHSFSMLNYLTVLVQDIVTGAAFSCVDEGTPASKRCAMRE